jgi:N,N'-diacetyllegionaminate synthase
VKRFKKLFLIAEIGSVHDGSFGNAFKLIQVAKDCGASAVKFQLHDAENETLKNAPNPKYFRSEKRYSYFQRTAFDFEQMNKLKKFANKLKLKFIVSPFSIEAAKMLKKINIDGYKIASGEVTNHPLLNTISSFNKNIYLSTGMSTYKEINNAVKILKTKKLTLMQCTSQYPCPVDKVGLNVLEKFKKYNCYMGFSDHTLGFSGAISFIANGVSVIEKHITFSKLMYGSDAKHSMEPNEFRNFAKETNDAFTIYQSLIDKNNIFYLRSMRKTFQKSIYIKKNITKGDTLSLENLSFKKPDLGISASNYKKIIGKKILRNLKKDHKLSFKDFNK